MGQKSRSGWRRSGWLMTQNEVVVMPVLFLNLSIAPTGILLMMDAVPPPQPALTPHGHLSIQPVCLPTTRHLLQAAKSTHQDLVDTRRRLFATRRHSSTARKHNPVRSTGMNQTDQDRTDDGQ